MMNDALKLDAAIREAERFVERAKAIQSHKRQVLGPSVIRFDAGPKETGAARRASLDLTRALADLRRPS